MVEADLFHGLSEDRLRRRCLWAGTVLALSVLVPYEVVGNQPHFLWELVGELPPSGVLGAFAPLLAGALIIAAGRLTRRPASLAIIVLAALATLAIVETIGSEAAAWGLLPLPRSFADRSTLALVALALTAAGSNLAFRQATQRPARGALIAGFAVALLFYALPGRGEAPGMTVLRNLSALGDMPSLHFQLGLLTLATVALWPALVSALGLLHLRRPPARSLSTTGMAATLGFPLILGMLLFSWFVRASPGAALFGALGAAAEISAVLALYAGGFEVLGQTLLGDRPEAIPHGWLPSRTAAVCATSLVLLCGGQAWLARPPAKGVRWTLSPPTPGGDALFAGAVVQWSDTRYRWDRRVRHDSSARALVEVKRLGKVMVESAEKIDPELGERVEALARAGRRLDTSSRTWYRLVEAVNQASRDATLPYYLDPRVSIDHTEEGLVRHLIVNSFRVEDVKGFEAAGESFAVLHVRTFGTRRGGHFGMLGLSRDVQPYALVVLDETERHELDLRAWARESPPRCGEAFDSEREEAMLRCGRLVQRIFAEEEAAPRAVLTKVERHELQHQMDGPLLPLSTPVIRKLGAYHEDVKERVNRELSAYLAQLTVEGPVKLGLVIPLRFALLQDRGIYHHAAVLLFEALAGRDLRNAAGALDAGRLTEAFDQLLEMKDAALRERAAEAWAELFDDALPPLRSIP